MWVVHLLIAGTLLLAHYLLLSISVIPSLLVGIVGLYFFFRGLNGARDRFAPPVPVTDSSVVHALHAIPGDVWNGDHSQLPRHDATPPQPSIEYPGVVPLSIQPEADPGLEQAPPQVAEDPFMVRTHIRLQPEEPTSGDESQGGATRKP